MHYKDGTPAKLGDIVQHDTGAVGIVIGGTIGSDYCSTQVVMFRGKKQLGHWGGGPGFVGLLRDEKQAPVGGASVVAQLEPAVQTRECLKIGHVDLE